MSESDGPQATQSTGLLRARRVVSENYTVFVVLLLVVGGLGVWAGYTAVLAPGTVTEERTVSTWSRSAEFTHGAEVTRPNPVYTEGVRLEGRQAYFPSVSPFLNGEYRIEHAASNASSLEADVDLQLVVRGSEDGTTFWQTVTELNRTGLSLPADRTRTVRYRFNMSRVQERLERVEDVFGDVPGEPEVLVRAETRLTGEVNGRLVDRRYVDELRLVPDGDSFRVENAGEWTDSYSETATVRVERGYSPLWQAGSLLAVVAGLGGAGGLALLRRRDALALSPAEEEWLVRERYEEWVSRGELPGAFDTADEAAVEMESLAALVDVAADTGQRVLYSPDRGWYVVLDDQYSYFYRSAAAGSASGALEGDSGSEASDDGESGEE
jgi:hypothetical protein